MVSKASIRRPEPKGEKGVLGTGMVARWYAGITAKNMAEFANDAQRMTKYLSHGDAVLEVAPGPGYLAIALAKLGNYRVVGLDISQAFVNIARQKAGEAGVQVDFRQGDVSQMPFPADSFNLIICRAAFKNFAAPITALNEMYRVLKVGGKAVIMDLRKDASPAEINTAVDAMGLNAINRFITKWTFKHMLLKRAYTADAFRQMIARTAFTHCDIQPDAIGLEVRLEK
jgi:ubiquinone/menaquinone biosynthesis C-methylase UbiE